MNGQIHWTALAVFVFFFLLVTVLGFIASGWQTGGQKKDAHLDEWGLGGRNFGTWITWFLVG
ncbi:MAG: solute symporter family protein, partial [Rhodoferax sp.]|nr:solute symporter family protein [Rhodoferax sp.]